MKRLVCCAAVLWTAVMFSAFKSDKAEATSASLATDESLAKSKEVFNRKRAERDGKTDDFELLRIRADELGKVHTKFRQTVNGIPVWGGEAIVHLNEDGSLSTITDNFKDGISVSTESNVSAEGAVVIARQSFGTSETREPLADLWIYRGDDRDHLVYRIQFEKIDQSKETGMPVYFVDAQTGDVVFHRSEE